MWTILPSWVQDGLAFAMVVFCTIRFDKTIKKQDYGEALLMFLLALGIVLTLVKKGSF
jgi:hypothetical protein